MLYLYFCTVAILFIIRCRFPKNKSIADIIKSRYGNHVLKSTRKYEKLDYKYRKAMLDIEFLESCLTNDVVPNFLKFRLANPRLRDTGAYKDCQRRLMNSEIELKNVNRNRLHLELLKITEDIKKVLSFFDWTHLSHLSISCNISRINKVKHIQNYKLSELVAEQSKHDPDDVIKNFSSYELNEIETSLLVKGLNYAIPPKKLKFQDYLLPFELLYRDIYNENSSPENLLHLKSGIKDQGLSSYRVYNKKDHRYENLSVDEFNAFVNLSKNDDIIIQKADKGNTVVLIDRTVYLEKMEALLNDESKFLKIKFNSKHVVNKEVRYLLDMEVNIKSCLDELLQGGYVTKEDYKYMKPVGSKPGVMYGLCKIHKDTEGFSPPFRPILSAIGTSAYKLAKFLVPVLRDHTMNEYSVSDSFSFAGDVIKQDASLYMATFDVKSLFTNVPLDETIEICVNKLYAGKKKVKGLLKRHFKQLLNLATKSSCFLFNGNYFCQIDGVAMGSPLGPTLANLFLSHYESMWLDNCPRQFRPVYYKRYVDDVFMLFNDQKKVLKFLRYLNSRHLNIEFSKAEERDGVISFLDVGITRVEGKFVTSIYRKETFSGVYSNYFSFIPREYKRGLLNTLLHRAYMISSSYLIFHAEIQKLKEIWVKNSFPLFFIDNSIRKFLNNLFLINDREKSQSGKKEVTMMLPYLGLASIQLKKKLIKLVHSYCPEFKLCVIFSAKSRLCNGFNYKDQIPNDMRSLVLYNYKCGICINTYVGKTKRHYIVRRNEHLGISVLSGKPFKYNPQQCTAIRKHINDNNHQCDSDSFKIVGTALNDFHLRLKESLLILKEKPMLNVASESLPLYVFT